MEQLPAFRVTPDRPFSTAGADYVGPFTLKTFQGRGAKSYKGWIAVFVCFVTSAVHLEVVTDYSTDAFLKAYCRFVSRQGLCSTLYSECGTSLQGAHSGSATLFQSSSKENYQLGLQLSNQGTKWLFSPPSDPHCGGKWEAAVKLVMYYLERVIGEAPLTYEDLSKRLSQIEAVLNSRTLCPLTDDPEYLNALTPA